MVSVALRIPECHLIRIVPELAFSDWLLSLSDMHVGLLHVFSWFRNSFLFSTEQYVIVWMDPNLFIHSLIEIQVASKFWQL